MLTDILISRLIPGMVGTKHGNRKVLREKAMIESGKQRVGRQLHCIMNSILDKEPPLQLVQSDRLSEARTVPGGSQVENITQPDRMKQMMTLLATIMQRQMELNNKREEDRK